MSLFDHSIQWRNRSAQAKKAGGFLPAGKPGPGHTAPAHTLADVRPGTRVRVTGFDRQITSQRWSHLQSYGLVPGSFVSVLQHSPVTIVQIEHLELALEADLARLVNIAY